MNCFIAFCHTPAEQFKRCITLDLAPAGLFSILKFDIGAYSRGAYSRGRGLLKCFIVYMEAKQKRYIVLGVLIILG